MDCHHQFLVAKDCYTASGSTGRWAVKTLVLQAVFTPMSRFIYIAAGCICLMAAPVHGGIYDCGGMHPAIPYSVECGSDAVEVHNKHIEAHQMTFNRVLDAIAELKIDLENDMDFIRHAFIYPFWGTLLSLLLGFGCTFFRSKPS